MDYKQKYLDKLLHLRNLPSFEELKLLYQSAKEKVVLSHSLLRYCGLLDLERYQSFYEDALNKVKEPLNTEDKKAYAILGGIYESCFLIKYGHESRFNLPYRCNPEKRANYYAIDFKRCSSYKNSDLYKSHPELTSAYADSKEQPTPFYTMYRKGLDPQYTMTMNQYDILEYRNRDDLVYIIILNYLNKESILRNNKSFHSHVRVSYGVWMATPKQLYHLNKLGKMVSYQTSSRRELDSLQEVREKGYKNKKDNFAFDVRNTIEIYVDQHPKTFCMQDKLQEIISAYSKLFINYCNRSILSRIDII